MKGAIDPNHIPVNNFELLVLGLPGFTFTEISGMEDEIQKAEMPDRTVATGGNRGPTEFTAMLPLHHRTQQAAMEIWFREGQDPVSPLYKKVGTLLMKSIEGTTVASFAVAGLWPYKRKKPDLEMGNEGELAQVEWTFSADDVEPLP
jgi:hypothetical protein